VVGLAFGSGYANALLGGSADPLLQALNVNASYSYAGGFGAGVGVSTLGAGEKGLGLTAGLNYNEKTGFGASVGLEFGFGGQFDPDYNLGAAYNVNSIGRKGQNANISVDGRMNNLAVSAWRDIKNSNSYGGSISYSGQLNDRSILKGYTTSLNWSNGQGFSNSFNYSLSDQFVKDINQGVRDPIKDFMTSMWNNARDVAFGAAGYVAGLFKDEKKERQNPKIANVYPGPRPGTFIDENGQVLVRDPKTGNLINEGSIGTLVNVNEIGVNGHQPGHEVISELSARIAGINDPEIIEALKRGVQWNDLPLGSMGGITDLLSFLRSHFKDLQHFHAMASKEGEDAEVTKEKIVSSIKKAYQSIIAKDVSGNYLLSESERAEIIGRTLHIILDSYAPGHVIRNENGEIIQFQTYRGQDKEAHRQGDLIPMTPGGLLDLGKLKNTRQQVAVSSEFLDLIYNKERNWDAIHDFLDNKVFILADFENRKPSGVDYRYKKRFGSSGSWDI
jgi:hypothetical protein